MSQQYKASILVIDDEPDLRLLYELTLLREGYSVESAESLQQARDKLRNTGFDVVLTDMRLPDGLGMEILQELQQSGRRERCVVVTAYGSPENAVEALRAGAFDYLSKPVELKQLRTVVASAVQGQTPHAEAAPVAAISTPAAPAATATAAVAAATTTSAAAAPASLAAKPVTAAVAPRSPAPSTSNTANTPAATGSAAPATPARRTAERVISAAAPASNSATGSTAGNTPAGQAALERMVGCSPAMQQVKERIVKVARSMAPVHIHGESGTGKELVARALHANSQRADGPMVAVNCGAIPENLLEAEFFGAKKGSYTGATQDRQGFFQAASGGTLFLDEIGDLPLTMQTKLLRVIQERSVRPLGTTQEETVNVRLVSATHKDLAKEVEAGRFRQDLYYRLNVIAINIPALRERREDLPSLVHALLERLCKDSGLPKATITDEFMQAVLRKPLPGNVRELENLLYRALALSDGVTLHPESIADDSMEGFGVANPNPAEVAPDFSDTLPEHEWEDTHPPAGEAEPATIPLSPLPSSSAPALAAHSPAAALAALPSDLQAWLDEQERAVLIRALQESNYNRTAAAAKLGLNLRQIRYRIERLGITVNGNSTD